MEMEHLHKLASQALSNQIPSTWQRIGEAYGFASTIWRIPFPNHTNFILKLWESSHPDAQTELSFYKHLAPTAGINTPKCHYQYSDQTNQKYVLILQDLTSLAQGDCLKTPTTTQSSGIIKQFVKFHSTWWNSPTLNEHSFITPLMKLTPKQIQTRSQTFLSKFSDHIHLEEQKFIATLPDQYPLAYESLLTQPQVLIHADFHLDNILFNPSTHEPTIIDWSRLRKGPPTINLAHILIDMAIPEIKNTLINLYSKTLQKYNLLISPQEVTINLRPALIYNYTHALTGTANWNPTTPRQQDLILDAINRRSTAYQCVVNPL